MEGEEIVEPAGAETVDTTDASDVDTTDVDTATDAPEAEPEITPDTFGWDAWDGSPQALPESVRSWAERLAAYHEKPVKAAREEAERARKIFESLTSGQEDPRLAELQKKLSESEAAWTVKHSEIERQAKEVQEKLRAYEEYHESLATKAADEFQAANAWMFDDGPIQKLAEDLIEKDGFHYQDLPTLMRMPARALDRARELMKEFGNPKLGSHAIKLAKAEFSTPEPTPSEALVAGTDGATNNAAATDHVLNRDASYKDIALHSIRSQLRLARG